MGAAKANPARTLLLVGVIAAGAALIVSSSYEFSRDRIIANERARLVQSLYSVLDPQIEVSSLNPLPIQALDSELLGSDDAIDVFVITDNGNPISVIFASIAPDGYNAAIQLLIGISVEGVVSGVRVISHRETPGLGDDIEIAKSDWIRQFDGATLQAPSPENWSVDKDGGSFDSLTGATVTPRAIVAAVKNTLSYFQLNKDQLFDAAIQAERQSSEARSE